MSALAPLQATFSVEVPAVAITTDELIAVGVAPWAGTLTSVTYEAAALITGVTTNTRTLNLINGGQAGAGVVNMAGLALITGVNAVAEAPTVITRNATAANLTVAAGDIIQWQSLHGGTGIADPGGLVTVTLNRS